jgi:hypothetical protein
MRSRPENLPYCPQQVESDRPEIRFRDSSNSVERKAEEGSWQAWPKPNRDDPSWPPQPNPSHAHPSWPNAPAPRARMAPDFIQKDHRWPELPSVPEELLRIEEVLRDEASLRAEQIGGAWSE